jgi:hypothetical protein
MEQARKLTSNYHGVAERTSRTRLRERRESEIGGVVESFVQVRAIRCDKPGREAMWPTDKLSQRSGKTKSLGCNETNRGGEELKITSCGFFYRKHPRTSTRLSVEHPGVDRKTVTEDEVANAV